MTELPETPKNTKRLILFSQDRTETALALDSLDQTSKNSFEIERIESISKLKQGDIESKAEAILLDMRMDQAHALELIEWLGDQQSSVALIALCRDHNQLQNFNDVIHYIDDYLLADQLAPQELNTRITHALRRRSKEHNLLKEQNLLHSLLENIPDKIFFKDLESRFIKVNEAMASSYGFTTESIIGRSDFDIFTEEHAKPAYDDEQQIIQSGTPLVGKIEKETFEDGSLNWANTTKLPLRNSNGRIIGTMGIARDITELKTAQDKLTEERELLETIVTNALAGIFVKNRDGTYLLANQKHCDYLGAPNTEAVRGKTIRDFFSKEMADAIDAADNEIMDTCQSREGIVDQRIVDGKAQKWLLSSKFPLRDDSGKCRGLVGIAIDITKQKENEEALKDAIQTLEETKIQLIESEKLKTVGRMAAGIAHEVKNPLNIISLGADYLKTQITEPKDILELIEDIKVAVTRANDVIVELLDLASPHSTDLSATDLNHLINNACHLLKHNLNKAHIKLETNLADSLPPVAADIGKMEQAFINLILNAINAMDKGGTLEINSYTHMMKGAGSNLSSEMHERFQIGAPIVTIEIMDAGHGIAPDHEGKIFDPFFSTNSTGQGTGLGLSVTRSIIEIHRGIITLENRKDRQGACARLHFPATA